MKTNFDDSYSMEVQEKTKKNLVWLLVFSICMMFAGFTSAYIVSMGDSFWIKIDLPTAFFISTAVIIVSSITMFLAVRSARKGSIPKARIFILITLFLGITFGFFQYQGYKNLVDRGAFWVSHIIIDDGRYGDYFEIKKDGEYLKVANNQYVFNGEQLEGEQLKNLQDFAQQFLVKDQQALSKKPLDYGYYTLIYKKKEPLVYVDGALIRPNGEHLNKLSFSRLRSLARNVVDNRADFFMKGEMGKDFKLFYNSNELDYKGRKLMYKGKKLSINLNNKLLRGNKDTSTAYFYIITVLHLLHVLGGVIMLFVMTIRSFSINNSEKMTISLRAGSIFWHFLGVLWIYLLLFLLFIH